MAGYGSELYLINVDGSNERILASGDDYADIDWGPYGKEREWLNGIARIHSKTRSQHTSRSVHSYSATCPYPRGCCICLADWAIVSILALGGHCAQVWGLPWETDYRASPDSGTWLVPASFGLALLCLISGVGLLFRKQWARVTVLGLMGFWLVVGLLGVGKAICLVAFDPQISPALSGWPGVRFILFLGIVLICLPASYLFYFSRRTIKQLFTGGHTDSRQSPKEPIG